MAPDDRFSDPAVAEKILRTCRTFAVVGCSNEPGRPSNGVAGYLSSQGYRVLCINPNVTQCLDLPCYPDLGSVNEPIDVVDIFRRSEFAGAHVDEAIEIGAKAVWMQLGVIDEDAAARAQHAGLAVVMDRCPAIDHRAMMRSA